VPGILPPSTHTVSQAGQSGGSAGPVVTSLLGSAGSLVGALVGSVGVALEVSAGSAADEAESSPQALNRPRPTRSSAARVPRAFMA